MPLQCNSRGGNAARPRRNSIGTTLGSTGVGLFPFNLLKDNKTNERNARAREICTIFISPQVNLRLSSPLNSPLAAAHSSVVQSLPSPCPVSQRLLAAVRQPVHFQQPEPERQVSADCPR